MLGNNPLIYLAKKDWEFSAGNRKKVIVFLVLFILANAVSFFEPIILAQVINTIQQDVAKHSMITFDELLRACRWLSLLILSEFLFWACHGPARILE